MSISGYSISKGKTRFNIALNSTQSDRTGALYDAFYPVDLRGHLDVSDFQKEYNVYLAFQSVGTTFDEVIGPPVLMVHLELGGNQINSYAFAERKTPHFLVFKSYYTGASPPDSGRYDTKITDNAPIRVKSLYNLDKIGFNVINTSNQTFATSLDYQVILSFEEVEKKLPVAFNIYLPNFGGVAGRTGINGNARFQVDLNTLVSPDDFSKSYKVYLTAQSLTGSSSIALAPAYFLDVIIGSNFINGENNFRTLNPRFLFGSEVTESNYQFYVNMKNNINPPIILKSLYGVDFIQVKTYSSNGTLQTNFIGSVYILRFEEITD